MDNVDKGNGSITIVDHQRENLRPPFFLPFFIVVSRSSSLVTVRRVG